MALEYKDRVADLTITVGTGTITMANLPPVGSRAFAASGYSDGARIRYCIATADLTSWEVGEGIWTAAAATLSRLTVFASSNAGALVNFAAGSKVVTAVMTARDLVQANYVRVPAVDTWNPAQLGPGVTLDVTRRQALRNISGNDSPDNWNHFSSIRSRTTGLCYIEFIVQVDPSGWCSSFGLVDASYNTATVTTVLPTQITFFVRPRFNVNPVLVREGVATNITSIANLAANLTHGMLIDFDAGKLWAHLNGQWLVGPGLSTLKFVIDPTVDLPTHTFTPNRALKLWGESPFQVTALTINNTWAPAVATLPAGVPIELW